MASDQVFEEIVGKAQFSAEWEPDGGLTVTVTHLSEPSKNWMVTISADRARDLARFINSADAQRGRK